MKTESFCKYQHRFSRYCRNAVQGYFTEYETPKLVLIHSFKFAVLLRILQIIILIYSIIYLLIYEKGYQKHDSSIISSVTLKVKGIGYIQASENQTIVTDVAGLKKNVLFKDLSNVFFSFRLCCTTIGK